MFLYHFARSFRPKGSVLDVGCGCGILGLLLKRDFPSVALSMIDIQEEHTSLAEKNATENRLGAEVIRGDFMAYDFGEKFDFVVSNPPFYHENTKKSEDKSLIISRYATSLPLDRFLAKSFDILKPKGSLIFCYDAKQIEDIFVLSAKNKLKVCDICFVYPRADKECSLLLVMVKKESNSFVKIHSPLFVFDGESYSKGTKEIFLMADTRSVDWA